MKQKLLEKKRRRKAARRLRGRVDSLGSRNPEMKAVPAKNFRMPICFSDLMDRVPTEAELDQLVTTFARAPTFLMLAMLNTFLSFYQHAQDDRETFTFVQGFLFQNLTDEDTFERARQRFPHDNMGARPIFHRQQMLVMLKKILLRSDEQGRNDPNDGKNKDARYALGTLLLMANDLLNPAEQAQNLLQKDDTEEDRQRRYEEFCTQMLPMYELSNPADVIPALVRNDEYFNLFEQGALEGKFLFSDGDSIANRFLKLTGLNLRDYLLMILSIYMYYEGTSHAEGAVKLLIEKPQVFNVGVNETFRKMKFSDDEVRAFFRQTAIGIEGLVAECRVVRSKSDLMQQHDFTAFRTYPLLYTRDEQDFATLIDHSFLAEKISTGVYYNIKLPLEQAAKLIVADGDLETAEKVKEAERDHRRFLGYWGEVFDKYANDRLSDARPRGLKHFYRSPHYDEPPSKSDHEAFDAVLNYGHDVVLIEHKGKYLDLASKYSGDREMLLAELTGSKRIGEAITQLADNIQLILDNRKDAKRLTFHDRDSQGRPAKRFELRDIQRVRRIYPLVVHQDFSLRLNGINQIVGRAFRREIAKRHVDLRFVRPLCILSIEDLEVLIPYLADVSLPDVLEFYAAKDDPLTTFRSIFNRLRRKRHIANRRNEWIDQRSEEIFQRLKASFVDLN
ncbi:MAG TPA: hypothetical protein VJT71_02765 [Pyrinomonadaceae bacterium]|nr:hypothetical protein [Pyrinomonadaceae bacterium]